LFKRRYEEGYDIYDEAYVRWLLTNHPDDIPSEWLTKAATSSKVSDSTQRSVGIESSGENGDRNEMKVSDKIYEDLFKRRYKEGYDIYDEAYVRWLMTNHPDDIPSECLTKTATSSTQQSTLTKDSTRSNEKTILNYDNLYGALNWSRKRPFTQSSKPGPPQKGNCISEYLHQLVSVPKQKNKQMRISGARVKMRQDKEGVKKWKAIEVKKRKEKRERKS